MMSIGKIRYFRGVPDDGIHTRHHLFRIDEAANILLVNRQVYLEAVPIPYKNVEFKFKRDWSFLELFMTAIGRTNQACIRHITYTQSYYHSEYPEDILVNNRLKDLVESSPNLEKLEVSSPYACSRYFMKKVGLSDARLGSLLQHKGSLFLETSHGLVRHSMSYMIEDFERCIDKIVGADAAQKQKYLDLLEFTNEWRRPSRGPIV